MLNTNGNLRIKIIGGILAAFNLALISAGLVSCGAREQQPLAPIERQRSEQQLNENDDDDNEKDERGDRRSNDKNDDDDDDKD